GGAAAPSWRPAEARVGAAGFRRPVSAPGSAAAPAPPWPPRSCLSAAAAVSAGVAPRARSTMPRRPNARRSMPQTVRCMASLLRRSLGNQGHPGKPGAVDEAQRVHQLSVADRAITANIDDAGGIFRRQPDQQVLQIGGGDRLVADEGAAFLVDT